MSRRCGLDRFDVIELAADILGKDLDKYSSDEEIVDVINNALTDEMRISLTQFHMVVESLISYTPTISLSKTKTTYHAFLNNEGEAIVKVKTKVAQN